MVLNGGSSLRELFVIIDGLVSFSSQSTVDAAGRALLALARRAWLSRQNDLLDQAVLAILAVPLDPRVHGVAHYYRKQSLRTPGNTEQTRIILERLADAVRPEHKPRILLGLAGCYLTAGDAHESAKIYFEAARTAADIDPLSQCAALRGLALIRSSEGDHRGSLADLERLFPVMRSFAAIYPEDYHYYLNNLAYELGEVGRIDEAKAAINVALRSPYADRFPDWAETAQELETKRRRAFYPLSIAIGAPADQVVGDGQVNRSRPMPVVGTSPLTSRVAYGRAKATASYLIQVPCKSGQPAFAAGQGQKRLVEIIEGVTRLRSQAAVDATGRQLVEVARQALLSRDFKLLDETVLALLALPLDTRTHAVARYYKAYSAYALRKSEGSDQTRLILERLSDSVLPEYRPRTILALGNCYASAGDHHKSTKIYMEAGRAATGIDPFTKCQAIRALALLRSCDGDHAGSLADLERLFPVMRSFAAIYPEDYHYYLNNLAYELGEVGRIDEAKAAINVALRNPNAHRVPDWAETAQELETKRRRAFAPLFFAIGRTPESADQAEEMENACPAREAIQRPGEPGELEQISKIIDPEIQSAPARTAPTPSMGGRKTLEACAPRGAPAQAGPTASRAARPRSGFNNFNDWRPVARGGGESHCSAARLYGARIRITVWYQAGSARAPPGSKTQVCYLALPVQHPDGSMSAWLGSMFRPGDECICALVPYGGTGLVSPGKGVVCSLGARAPPASSGLRDSRPCLLASKKSRLDDTRSRDPPNSFQFLVFSFQHGSPGMEPGSMWSRLLRVMCGLKKLRCPRFY